MSCAKDLPCSSMDTCNSKLKGSWLRLSFLTDTSVLLLHMPPESVSFFEYTDRWIRYYQRTLMYVYIACRWRKYGVSLVWTLAARCCWRSREPVVCFIPRIVSNLSALPACHCHIFVDLLRHYLLNALTPTPLQWSLSSLRQTNMG